MKFVKQSQINFRNVKDTNLAVVIDGPNADYDPSTPGPDSVYRDERIVMEVTNSLLVPKGSSGQRPASTLLENGMIRYNTTTDEFEGRQGNEWRAFRFKEATGILQETVGTGDAVELNFPITSFTPPSTLETGSTWGSQNVVVLVENVYQIAGTNYTIIQLDGTETGVQYPNAPYAAGWYVQFDTPVPYGKPVTTLYGFDR